MLNLLFKSIKKSFKIKNITKNYLKYNVIILDFSQYINSEIRESRKEALNKVIDLSFFESLNQEIIKSYKIDINSLKDKFLHLEAIGCGIMIKGHYVSISSLMYPQTLEFVFHQKINTRKDCDYVAHKLIDWFDKGKSNKIIE